ncbi:MAG TPA: hypothetical protein VMW23_03830 [Sedimentisphaerales bacterium]|nr:hypothetical protein [Sedimentisphaerales bacterium]
MERKKNSGRGRRFSLKDAMVEVKKRLRKDMLVWAGALLLIAAIAFGDVQQGSMEVDIDTGNYQYARLTEETALQQASYVPVDTRLRSLKFEPGLGVVQALAMLARVYEKNIVPSGGVDGTLAFRDLSNVTFEEALEAILGAKFKYEQTGNLLKVYTRAEYLQIKTDQDRMITRVFTLYYITAKEAQSLVTPVLSSAGVVKSSSAAEIGVPAGESITSDSAGGDTIAAHDILIMRDFPENITEAAKLLRNLDVRPKQVLIEATIMTATLTEAMQFGADLNLLAGVSLDGTASTADIAFDTGVRDGTAATTPISQIAGGTKGTPLQVAGFAFMGSGLRIGVTSGDVAAFITAVESVTDVTVLANPKILAVNKQLGQVYIGTKLGYIAQTTQTQTSTTQSVKFLDTGTKLSFRPYIGNDGYIRMDIHPKDSTGQLNAQGVPDETSAELATNIIVKDGQTIVIGGLFRDVVTKGRSQIPIIGNIPILGDLLSKTSDSSQRQEVIVLLTPHIIEEPSQTRGRARAEDVNRKVHAAAESLRWETRARMAEEHYEKAAKAYLEGDTETALKEVRLALELRATYLEALRLKDRIMAEEYPDLADKTARKILRVVERRDMDRWLRR